MSSTASTPAGWYPDTNLPGTERYWDGAAWTDQTRAMGGAIPAPVHAPLRPASNTDGWGAGQPPSNHLVMAILSTVLCCLPLGVTSIVFSAQVNRKWNVGDFDGARRSSQKAKNFWIASVAVSVVLIALALAMGAFSGSTTTTTFPQ